MTYVTTFRNISFSREAERQKFVAETETAVIAS